MLNRKVPIRGPPQNRYVASNLPIRTTRNDWGLQSHVEDPHSSPRRSFGTRDGNADPHSTSLGKSWTSGNLSVLKCTWIEILPAPQRYNEKQTIRAREVLKHCLTLVGAQ